MRKFANKLLVECTTCHLTLPHQHTHTRIFENIRFYCYHATCHIKWLFQPNRTELNWTEQPVNRSLS